MKKRNENVCPGCSRHCPMNDVRCKRGARYFAGIGDMKMKSSDTKGDPPGKLTSKKCKWERYVAEGNLLWQLLHISRHLKRLLRSGIPEGRLLSVLNEEERDHLESILNKIDLEIKRIQ